MAGAPSTEMVIVHPEPGILASWLAPEIRARVVVVDVSELSDPARTWGVDETTCHIRPGDTASSNGQVDWLPLDGPRRAVALAIRALRRRHSSTDGRPLVVPVPIDGSPPSVDVLRAVAAAELMPAADLGRVRWVGGDGIWWCQGEGTLRVPLPTASLADGRRSAEVLCSLRGFDPTSRTGLWLRSVAEGAASPALGDWYAALASHYVAMTLLELSRDGSEHDAAEPGLGREVRPATSPMWLGLAD